jgi:mannose-6-phosphate isomerase-like protein (cupin superfamily)
MLERINYKNHEIAIIIRNSYTNNGCQFFTPEDYSQQLGYMRHKKGHQIEPHYHLETSREVKKTQEVLFIKSGKVRVNFFTTNEEYIQSIILQKGDVILLASQGHGFEMLEETEMIEVKQGPYKGELDKKKFKGNILK